MVDGRWSMVEKNNTCERIELDPDKVLDACSGDQAKARLLIAAIDEHQFQKLYEILASCYNAEEWSKDHGMEKPPCSMNPSSTVQTQA